ncbi:hypothetical protein AGLY_012385 [Aphis glycines]|uniref:PiggyBac transposable element-derived protein domain-containing protein n=1 Tax=Aphis glycines TaxID=307491 RepID=A0A6G0T9X7_APHGL|nr:hypothetical protein AGLY_012385 [Aphis glycines]
MDDFEKRRIEFYLEETDQITEVWGGESSGDENVVENDNRSDHDTDSEQSVYDLEYDHERDEITVNEMDFDNSYNESDDDVPLSMRVQYFVGKDGTKWFRKNPTQNIRTIKQNLVTEKSGVKGVAKNAKSEMESWEIFFSNPIIETIVKCTNIYIAKVRCNFSRDRDALDTNNREIKALIGCLYIIGAIKGGHRSTLDLWKTDGLGAELLPCVMSEKRFQFLLRCIRFDDIRGRDERIKVDKITHIRIQPDGPFKLDNSASSVVKRLVQPFRNTGRNITTDNWFTSVPLAIDLFNNYKLTLVGTIRKNKRQLPIEFTSIKNRPIYTSYFGFSEDKVTIVSYTPKKNKIVLLLSTMHHSSTIDESTKEIKKPEIITFYNCTKGAVDTMDKKTENYTVARKSCRWPLTVFYSILNIAGLNSQIIFQENTKIKMSRLNFLKTLSRQLMEEQLKYRLTIDLLPKTIKFRLKQYATKTNEAAGTSQRVRASGRCAFCERAKDRKTTKVCTNCARLICRDHLIETCPDCFIDM